MSYGLKVAAAARADIDRILRAGASQFGQPARDRYAALIATALSDLRADPHRAGARPRDEISEGVRTYHLSHCRKRATVRGRRVAAPRHLLAFCVEGQTVMVLRVLHDAMELAEHLPRNDGG